MPLTEHDPATAAAAAIHKMTWRDLDDYARCLVITFKGTDDPVEAADAARMAEALLCWADEISDGAEHADG